MRGEFIDLQGHRLYYYAAGSRGSGEPIVLIHGFPTSSHLWLDVVAKLPPGHRVIVVDLLGFGRSDSPNDADYSVAGHGQRIVMLLDALGVERACMVGHGSGATIARWIAAHATQRVSRIAIFGGADEEGWVAPANGARRRIWMALLKLPPSIWAPLVRHAISRDYSDAERGQRSAELYLMPFHSPGRGVILRRHLAELAGPDGKGEIPDEMFSLIVTSQGAPWRFMPEEAPSEVAAGIAQLLRN